MKYLWIGVRLKKNHGGTIKTRFKFGLSWSVSLDAREQPTFARLDKSALNLEIQSYSHAEGIYM